jgi:sulfite reductase (NADPH) flavoprotein alpha-component
MKIVPLIPDNAPFSAEQRAWLNGFLAGVLNRGAPAPGAALTESKRSLLIAFGSQSGNAESLAKRLAREASGRGFAARAAGLDSLQPADFIKDQNVLLITSTWGEGDMPDNAVSFWDSINQNGSSPKLDGVKFSVLALGDKNYGDTFCLAGKKLDERLAELGATRIVERVDCDVDFDDLAKKWSSAAFIALTGSTETGRATAKSRRRPASPRKTLSRRSSSPTSISTHEAAPKTRITSPFHSLVPVSLTKWVTLSVFMSKTAPKWSMPSSLLTVSIPTLMSALPDGGTAPLRDALLKHYEVRNLLGKTPEAGLTLTSFLENLRKLQPRLYSIASSLKAHPEEVHLCIAAVRYSADGVPHKGVASTFLSDRLALGDTTGIYFHAANHFRLPADLTKPVIMVGPGTGIAPFRAFLEEREATGSRQELALLRRPKTRL